VSPVAALLVILHLLSGAAAGATAPFSLRHRFVDWPRFSCSAGWQALPADLDRDGDDDLVLTGPERAIAYTFGRGGWLTLWDATLPPGGRLDRLADATGDGYPDLLVVHRGREAAWIECRDPRREKGEDRALWRAGPFLDGCRVMAKMGSSGAVEVAGVFDADGDRMPEVYVREEPFVPGVRPRRLVCLDGATGRERWSYPLASSLTGVQLLVGREPPARRLLLQTYAPRNGFTVGAEDDEHCYVTCLSPDGRVAWSREAGGGYCATFLALADLDGDGEREIVATTAYGDGSGDARLRPSLSVLDPRNGRAVRTAPIPASLFGLTAGDLDGDGRDEVVATGRDQHLYVFDHDLRLAAVGRDQPFDAVLGIADLDGDGRREIAAACGPALHALDRNARTMARWQAPGALQGLARMRLLGRERHVMSTDRGGNVLTLEPPTVPPIALAGGGALLLAAAGGAGLVALRRRRAEALVERSEAQDRLLDAMVAFGHAGASLGVLHRLQMHLRNWERARAAPEGPAALRALREDYDATVLPDLVRIVALARRARVKPRHWRGLADRALAATAGLHRLIESARATVASPAEIESSLERVDSMLGGIRDHLRGVFRVSLATATRRALARHAAALAAAGVAVEVDGIADRDDPSFVGAPELDKVLDNLVDGAMRAMAGAAERRLTLALGQEGAYRTLDVRDSGCGIPASDHERVFERGFSSREGGGFGLHYAREALARYEGRIFVRESGPGRGTTFRIMLRAA
jgi:signal transduction histidine kinase